MHQLWFPFAAGPSEYLFDRLRQKSHRYTFKEIHSLDCECDDCLRQDARDAEAERRADMLAEQRSDLPEGWPDE